MSRHRPKPVVFLPDNSPARVDVLKALATVGVEAVGADGITEADVAVVDLTAADGPDALAALQMSSQGARLSVIAIIECVQTAGSDPVLMVADFVTRGALEAELPLRLRQTQARHAALSEAQQRQRDLSLLLKLTADYAESLDAEELLYDVTRRLAGELDIERASLVVIDEQAGAGFIVAASDDPTLKNLRIELSRYPEIKEVVRTGKPVIVEEAPTHPLLEGVKSEMAARGYRNIAALPLAVQGKVLGVLLVRAATRRGAFNRREIDFLATVAHATAIALRNARHIETLRGEGEREKSARIVAEKRADDLQRYESYFAHFSDGIAILDQQSNVLSLNPAGLKLLDVGQQEVQGRHIQALTNPTDDKLLSEVLASVSRGELHHEIDIPSRTMAGRRLTLSVAAAPLDEGDARLILSMRDVTAEREMSEELKQTKDFLERLIDSSVDAIVAADMTGKIRLFNTGAEQLFGYSSLEALGRLNAKDLYPKGQARELIKRLRSAEFGGRGRLTVSRQEILDKSGAPVPVNMTASIIYEGDTEVATVGIFTDLRDRMKLERKLSDAETQLEESQKRAVLMALAGTAAHELNQPLTSVMGYAELLKRKLKVTDFAYRPVDIIHREAERMAEIVRKIGKITRYETKAYVGPTEILDLEKASSNEE